MLPQAWNFGVDVKCLEETYDTSDPAAVMLRAIKMAEPEMNNRRRAKNPWFDIHWKIDFREWKLSNHWTQ